jgi:hypothetical protein
MSPSAQREVDRSSSLSTGALLLPLASSMGSPGITLRSLAQAPRSMSLQRSLQNGRQGEAADHSTERLQVGQETVVT